MSEENCDRHEISGMRPNDASQRISSVDLARIMAALSVMFGHVGIFSSSPVMGWLRIWHNHAFSSACAIFFIISGYFCGKSPTWGKALSRAAWCFLAFAIWNLVAIAVAYAVSPANVADKTWLEMFGVGQIRYSAFVLGENPCAPVNGPLWFMRDLVILYLLTPLLARCVRIVLPCLVVLALFHETESSFAVMNNRLISLYSLVFFMSGCYMRTFSSRVQQHILGYTSSAWIAAYLGVSVLCCVDGIHKFSGLHIWDRHWYLAPTAMSIIIMYWIARYCEIKFKCATRFTAMFAPCTFLAYACHWPILMLMQKYTPLMDFVVVDLAIPPVIFLLCYLLIQVLGKKFPSCVRALTLVRPYNSHVPHGKE